MRVVLVRNGEVAIGGDFLGREFLLGMVRLLIFVKNGETAKRPIPPGANPTRTENKVGWYVARYQPNPCPSALNANNLSMRRG
jgi:hypothetical protein